MGPSRESIGFRFVGVPTVPINCNQRDFSTVYRSIKPPLPRPNLVFEAYQLGNHHLCQL
jgi:hypothetical protein